MMQHYEEILNNHLVRKSKKEKQAFISYLQSQFPEIKIEHSKFPENKNLILGNVEKANVLLCAHYDTCAQMPVPNFIMPLNPSISILYSFLITIPMFLAIFLINLFLNVITDNFWVHYFVSLTICFISMFIMLCGPANKNNVNDNTSGIITLLEIYQNLSNDEKERAAIVLFDNEEKGLLGSAAFRKKYKKQIRNKLMINFDCVSDGDHILFAVSKKAHNKYTHTLKESFLFSKEKTILIKKAEKTFYPSDQVGFPISIAVAALKHKKHLGYYMNRIHTNRDTVLDVRNINFLSKGIIDFMSHI